eukprot:TRINITY_DN2313_c0_g4_i1.p2 TRINITY_DN2313_c0_g4~~TRINITY_DN2313_c0_g4_i1.p2  ORF type:complete len:116 (+),score=6.50 TRINITY_DN2313_c0_g4_i1:40-387(+)
MRCISLAIENTHLMTPHALLLVARDLMPFAGSGNASAGDSGGWCQMPTTTFRDHFFPLVFTNDILLCHTVLVLQSLFAEQVCTYPCPGLLFTKKYLLSLSLSYLPSLTLHHCSLL